MKVFFLTLSLIAFLHAGDSFLEGYTFFSFLNIFLVLISPIVIGFTNKKTILGFFILLITSIGIDSSLSYIKDYTPSVSHWFQRPYQYGVYEEMEEIECLKDKNITGFIGNVPIASPYAVATHDKEIIRLQYSGDYKNEKLVCADTLKIDDISNTASIYLIYQWDAGGFHMLVSDQDPTAGNSKFLVYAVFPQITRLGYMTRKEYLDKYKVHHTSFENSLFHSKKSSADIKNSKDIGEIRIVTEKANQQLTVWGKDTKYLSTHLPYTPKYLLYDYSKDLIYIVYEEIGGLHVLRNGRTDDYTKVQSSIKNIIGVLIKPWWNKPDLSTIPTNVSKEKLEQVIQTFNPYTKKSRHVLQYEVLSHDNHLSIVKTSLMDEDKAFIFYLEKKDIWEIIDIKSADDSTHSLSPDASYTQDKTTRPLA